MGDAETGDRPVISVRGGMCVAMLLATAFAVGCGGPRPSASNAAASAPKTPDGRPLQAVVLPDLSAMAPAAQKQVRDTYAAVQAASNVNAASPVDLSAAYGQLGKLLMAAQFPEAAEASFANAQSLDPTDYRWPYYLAHLARTQGDLQKARGLFERAIALRPDDVAAHVWLGDAYLSLGMPDEADAEFT